MTGLKILAIDDSRTMRNLLRVTLEEAGHRVYTANDGEEGVQAAQREVPDVVITDIIMPKLDGFGVISALRQSGAARHMPILVLSTESGSALKDRARQGGATGWIVKPFDDAQLLAAIRRVAGC